MTMRVVVFDEESLEPITVVELPGLTDLALKERQDWRIAVPRRREGVSPDSPEAVQFLDLKFEQISRVTLTHGQQHTWLCLTRAAELAMLLIPDWLPGQRLTIQDLQRENERLNEIVAKSLGVSANSRR
jgi:hypothetical protein